MARVCLLAAGRGLRAGGPKAWLELEGRSLLERQLDFLTTRFAAEDIAVSIQPGWEKRCRALCPGARWTAVDPDASPLASLQALLEGRHWTFVYHVDMPVWEPGLFSALDARRGVTKAAAVAPSHNGRKGHPLLLSPRAASSIGGLDPAKDRLDSWLRGRAVEVVDVPWPCVLENWNGGIPA